MDEINAILFDMDGVLINSEPANLKQLNGFYQSYGTTVSEAFLISLVGSSLEYTWEVSIKEMNVQWDMDEFYQRFDVYAKQHPVMFHEILNEGVKETLIYLKERGYQTAIGSSSTMKNIQRMITECELTGLFDVVVSGEMFEESKPNPEIYLHIAQHLHRKPENCIVIEDSTFGIEAGKRANMFVIALQDTMFGIDQSKANMSISKISDLMKYL